MTDGQTDRQNWSGYYSGRHCEQCGREQCGRAVIKLAINGNNHLQNIISKSFKVIQGHSNENKIGRLILSS